MTVIDMNGKPIEIYDLDRAIENAEMYMCYYHIDEAYRKMDRLLHAYWKDLYTKLMALKSEQNDNTNV